MMRWNCGKVAFAIGILFALPIPGRAADPSSPTREWAIEFISKHCSSCHAGVEPKGQLILTKLTGKPAADPGEALLWARVLDRVSAGEMPPPSKRKPTAEEVATLDKWVKAELAVAAQARPRLMGVGLNAGNQIPHELLFGKPATGPGSSEPRVWRNRLSIYEDYYIRMLRPSDFRRPPVNYDYKQELEISIFEYSSPWGAGTGHGFKDYSGYGIIGESELSLLIANAEAAVAQILSDRRGTRKPSDMWTFHRATNPSTEQLHAAINEAFQQVIQRKPTPAERTKYENFYRKNKPLGHEQAARTTLTAVFLHPESVYRLEVGEGARDANGRTMLPPRELARAIAFALTDRAPDTELLQAADAGKLKSPADVRKQVERLFADDTIVKTRPLDFFRQYFGYPIAIEVFKDEKTQKAADARAYWPHSLVYDTDRLVMLVLKEDKDVLRELLTTQRSYVDYLRNPEPRKGKAPPMPTPKAHYNSYYGFQGEGWLPTVPVVLPPQERAGILTQPSWLIAHSTNFDNHAIERGKWIREKLLGGTLPDIPLTVEAKLPEDPHRTLRQRMQVTQQTFCRQCHQRMDPLGLTFEMFDHFGRYRTKELGQPVNAEGSLEGTGDTKLDGPVKNALELVDKLARSERVRQVFVRHAFRFWMGRNETPADAPTLQAADKAYRDSGGSMKALITSLVSSDPFLYRRPSTPK